MNAPYNFYFICILYRETSTKIHITNIVHSLSLKLNIVLIKPVEICN